MVKGCFRLLEEGVGRELVFVGGVEGVVLSTGDGEIETDLFFLVVGLVGGLVEELAYFLPAS